MKRLKIRKESAYCLADTDVLALHLQNFNLYLKDLEKENLMGYLKQLHNRNFLPSMDINQIKELYLSSFYIQFPMGSYIFLQDQDPLVAYFIISGDFSVIKTLNIE